MDEVEFGRYRLFEVIGEGGMGTVYRAHDNKMRRDVAIKVLPPYLAKEPGYRERFQREAYIAARLTEPLMVPMKVLMSATVRNSQSRRSGPPRAARRWVGCAVEVVICDVSVADAAAAGTTIAVAAITAWVSLAVGGRCRPM